ncbi:MAG TPA: hypothetical protein VL404_06465 [Candidatus Eisenbacteria bacterium]|jgi:tetratricopeptide (TPR) repeat protein|nr:hypothetical protein [Candidatus Eisenbacteria bacterium]
MKNPRALLSVIGVLVLAAAAGLLWHTAGQNRELRRELGDLKTQFSGAQRELERVESSEKSARRVTGRNLSHLRGNFLKLLEEKREAEERARLLREETENTRRAKEIAERDAAAVRQEAAKQESRAERLATAVDRLAEDKHQAEKRASETSEVAGEARDRLRSLVDKLHRYEAKEAEYEKAVSEYDDAVKRAETALTGLKTANSRIETLRRETAVAHYNLGVLYARQAQYAEAAREFQFSLSLDPSDPLTHYNLGLLYDAYLADPKAAVLHYEAYVRLLPSATDAQKVQQRIFQVRTEEKASLQPDLVK